MKKAIQLKKIMTFLNETCYIPRLREVGIPMNLTIRVIRLAKLSTEEAFILGYKKVKKREMLKFINLLFEIKPTKT